MARTMRRLSFLLPLLPALNCAPAKLLPAGWKSGTRVRTRLLPTCSSCITGCCFPGVRRMARASSAKAASTASSRFSRASKKLSILLCTFFVFLRLVDNFRMLLLRKILSQFWMLEQHSADRAVSDRRWRLRWRLWGRDFGLCFRLVKIGSVFLSRLGFGDRSGICRRLRRVVD